MTVNNQTPPPPLYLPSGRRFRTKKRKQTFVVEYRLGSGGQGTVFRAKNLDTGKIQVVKILHAKLINRDTRKGLDGLIDLRSHKLSRVFKPPLDIVDEDGMLGYIADYAEGDPVDVVVEKVGVDLPQSLMACLILAQSFSILHDLGFLHGDIRDVNIRIHVVEDRPFVSAIDWDGARGPGLPPSSCVGAIRYMAPELHVALLQNRLATPTKFTECYSFAAIFHELITMRYFLAGFDESAEAVRENSCKGKWIHNLDSTLYLTLGGYPPGILDASLANLFCRAFFLDPENRPSLHEWVDVLLLAIKNLMPCPRCRKPLLADHAKAMCPYCNRPFPTLKIVTPSGRHIVINSTEVVVGRADLGGSKVISRRHAYFRKLGPDVYVQNAGKLPMFRLNGHGLERLDDHVLTPIEHGQRLRVADVELVLERCEMDGKPFKP